MLRQQYEFWSLALYLLWREAIGTVRVTIEFIQAFKLLGIRFIHLPVFTQPFNWPRPNPKVSRYVTHLKTAWRVSSIFSYVATKPGFGLFSRNMQIACLIWQQLKFAKTACAIPKCINLHIRYIICLNQDLLDIRSIRSKDHTLYFGRLRQVAFPYLDKLYYSVRSEET